MRAYANYGRRWVAFVAMALFAFQALIASSALASSLGVGRSGATTIICTASGPRVVMLDADGVMPGAKQHSGALPHCCTVGCAMLGGAALPGMFLLAWLLPAAPAEVRAAVSPPHFSSILARLQQRSRAPPVLA